jgi:outer membrane protein OmpA-like peptidoglycan-associated protein
VPDEASKQRLQDLAIGASKPGQAALVDNQLTINPAVPRTVGARVVELTSTRFPDGSSEVLPAHAAELDRAVDIMNALPNITATIIGHADQRGDSLENYALSEDRALAVKNYMVSRGVDADRLQSRAVGEDDLLTLNDDAAALALNRRTEFVFVGLLTP